MAVGRFVCVALPLILIIASIVATLVAVLAGVAHHNLQLFTLDLKDLSINESNIDDFAKAFDIDLDNVDDLGDSIDDFADDISDLDFGKRDGLEFTAKTFNLSDTYEINLWGYCYKKDDGKRDCTDAKFNWAESALDPDKAEKTASAGGLTIKLPSEIRGALNTFRTVIKWAEVAFIIALIALGVEFFVGIFSNFSRGISCLTWLLASITAALVCAAAALATATSAVVIGAVEASTKVYGIKGEIDTGFLAAVWIGAALAIGAAIFWIFTICCCKPEHRSRRDKHRSTDGEKLLPTGGFSQRGYAPLDHEHEMTGGAYHSPSVPQFAEHHAAPRYPSGTASRSDLAYEPYSHRA